MFPVNRTSLGRLRPAPLARVIEESAMSASPPTSKTASRPSIETVPCEDVKSPETFVCPVTFKLAFSTTIEPVTCKLFACAVPDETVTVTAFPGTLTMTSSVSPGTRPPLQLLGSFQSPSPATHCVKPSIAVTFENSKTIGSVTKLPAKSATVSGAISSW